MTAPTSQPNGQSPMIVPLRTRSSAPYLSRGVFATAVIVALLLSGAGALIAVHSSASAPGSHAAAVRAPTGAGAVLTQSSGALPMMVGGARAVRPASVPTPTGNSPDALLASTNLLNGTFAAGYQSSPQGLDPTGVAVDSGTGEVFVADYGNARVSVFDPNLQTLIATIPVGANPDAVVYDPAGSEIFVANYGSNNVTVINDTTLTVVTNIPVGAQSGYIASSPTALAYSSTDKTVFVTQVGRYIFPCCSYNVTEISGLSNVIVRTVHVDAGPFAEAYDPSTDLLYVLNYEGYSLSVVNAGTGAVDNTFYFANLPLDIAIDPTDGILGVVTYDFTIANLTEYSLPGTSINFLHSTTLPGVPNYWGTMTYDPQLGSFVVAMNNRNFAGVNAINATVSQYAQFGACVTGLTYSALGPTLLATDGCANRVFALDPTTVTPLPGVRTGIEPTALSYDPGNDKLYVADGSGNTVTTVGGTTLQYSQRIDVGTGPSSFSYDPDTSTMYVLSDNGNGNASVEAIADATGLVTASIHLPPAAYLANPDTLTYDQYTHLVYVVGVNTAVCDSCAENLTVIDPATNSVIGNVTVTDFAGGSLGGGYYYRASLVPIDSTTVAVSDPWEGRVFGINSSTGVREWTAVTGGAPTYMVIDPVSHNLDVLVYNSPKISEVNPVDGTVAGSFTLQNPAYDFALDPANQRIYVDEYASGLGYVESLSEGYGASEYVVPFPATLAGVTYLPGSGMIAVADPSTSSVYFIGSALTTQAPSASPTPAVQDEMFQVSSLAADGFPPYSYAYTGLPTGCASSDTSQLNCTPAVSGNFTVSLRITDAANESVTWPLSVKVLPFPLNISLGLSPDSLAPKNGTSVTLTAQLPAGAPAQVGASVNYTWKLSPLRSAVLNRTYGPSVSVSFDSVANVTISLTSDLNGTVNITSVTFLVAAASPTQGTGTGPPIQEAPGVPWILVFVIGIVVVVIAAAAVLYLRQRRPPPPVEETESSEPDPAAEEAPAEEPAPEGSPPVE